ncbi:hypothetical protein GCM10027614_16170 [Micromonospora vulcania]
MSVAVLVFCYGTVVHVLQLLVPELAPQLTMPGWLTFYFTSLTLCDPLAALLLAARRVQGLTLGCVVLATDAAANGYANYVLDPAVGVTPGRVGQAVITALAVALVSLTPWLAPGCTGDVIRARVSRVGPGGATPPDRARSWIWWYLATCEATRSLIEHECDGPWGALCLSPGYRPTGRVRLPSASTTL